MEALSDVDPETRQAAVEVLSKAEVHVVAECSGGSSAGLDGPLLRYWCVVQKSTVGIGIPPLSVFCSSSLSLSRSLSSSTRRSLLFFPFFSIFLSTHLSLFLLRPSSFFLNFCIFFLPLCLMFVPTVFLGRFFTVTFLIQRRRSAARASDWIAAARPSWCAVLGGTYNPLISKLRLALESSMKELVLKCIAIFFDMKDRKPLLCAWHSYTFCGTCKTGFLLICPWSPCDRVTQVRACAALCFCHLGEKVWQSPGIVQAYQSTMHHALWSHSTLPRAFCNEVEALLALSMTRHLKQRGRLPSFWMTRKRSWFKHRGFRNLEPPQQFVYDLYITKKYIESFLWVRLESGISRGELPIDRVDW